MRMVYWVQRNSVQILLGVFSDDNRMPSSWTRSSSSCIDDILAKKGESIFKRGLERLCINTEVAKVNNEEVAQAL
jgi:hypothetical protein